MARAVAEEAASLYLAGKRCVKESLREVGEGVLRRTGCVKDTCKRERGGVRREEGGRREERSEEGRGRQERERGGVRMKEGDRRERERGRSEEGRGREERERGEE